MNETTIALVSAFLPALVFASGVHVLFSVVRRVGPR